MRLISQLVKAISGAFQYLLKYFNGTAISASFALSSAVTCPIIILIFGLDENLV